MKKLFVLLCVLLVEFLALCPRNKRCGKATLRVGMVTDAGTIDDKSFNQGTWEGILQVSKRTSVWM